MNEAQHLSLRFYKNPTVAPVFREPEFGAALLSHVNVVRNGTVEGRSTVDFVFQDEKGKKYAVMLTGKLVWVLANAIGIEP